MKITIEFYIFKSIYILNSGFNKQFWSLEQILKKVYFQHKTEKNEHHYWILHIGISLSKYQFSASSDNCNFLD